MTHENDNDATDPRQVSAPWAVNEKRAEAAAEAKEAIRVARKAKHAKRGQAAANDEKRAAHLEQCAASRCPICGGPVIDMKPTGTTARVQAICSCACGAAWTQSATAKGLDLWRAEIGMWFHWTTIGGEETLIRTDSILAVELRRDMDHDRVAISGAGGLWFELRIADGPALVAALRTWAEPDFGTDHEMAQAMGVV